MPSRVIKESITTSETLDGLSAEAERFFVRLIVVCDDYGRFDARPLIVLGRCFPLKIGLVGEAEIAHWLDDLEAAGVLWRYSVNAHPYLQMTTWERHQQKRAKKSKYPQPPEDEIECEPMPEPDCIGNHLLADDCNSPRETRNEKRETRNEKRGAGGANAPDPHILEVFQYYQTKIQPAARLIDAAKTKIKTRLETFKLEELKLGIDNFAADGWRMENNSHEGAPWFFASDARTEKFLNLVPNSGTLPRGKAGATGTIEATGPRIMTVAEACPWEKRDG